MLCLLTDNSPDSSEEPEDQEAKQVVHGNLSLQNVLL